MQKNEIIFFFTRKYLHGRFYKIVDRIFKLFNLRYRGIVNIDNTLFECDTNNYHERRLLIYGGFEESTQGIFDIFINRQNGGGGKSLVFDIGTNIGIHTAHLSKYADRVIGIEASPKMYNKVMKLKVLNKLDNVEIINKAVFSKSNETLEFIEIFDDEIYCNPGTSQLAQYHTIGKGSLEHQVTVNTITLDDLYFSIEDKDDFDIKLIKIDIEGAELEALKGAKFILENFSPALIIEYNSEHFEELVKLLLEYGYKAHGSVARFGLSLSLNRENILFTKDERLIKGEFN